MKKLWGLLITIIFASCSVENTQLDTEQISEADLIINSDGCSIYQFDFENKGTIEVRNYFDYIDVTVTATGTEPINRLSLHFAENITDFPVKGTGQLNTSRLYFNEKLDKETHQANLTFSFEELSIQTNDQILVAAVAEFGTGKDKVKLYAGDNPVNNGLWSYFGYEVTPFINYAGTDQVREITLSEARSFPSVDEVRKAYIRMLDEGVNRQDGVFEPSIKSVINDFADPNRESQLDDYTTTYTLGTGDCSDSVNLTMRVVAD